MVGVPVNNLGPLQLDLLAPFTRVAPYLGTGIGAALANAAAVTAVWVAARRLLGPWRVVAVMGGTLALMATLGLSWLIDARQQSALVLPLYALCWLVAAMAAGWDAAVPIGVGVASAIVQTHFTYVYPALVLSAFGVVAYVVVTRRRSPRRWAHTAAWGVGVAVLCWIQPLIDQLWGRGNLGAVLGPARRSQDAAGLRAGVEVLAGGVLTPPWWLPGSLRTFLRPYDGVSLAVAVIAFVGWLGVAVALAGMGPPHRRSGRGGAGGHRRGRPRRRSGGGRPGAGLGVRPGAAELLLALGRRGLRHDRAGGRGRARWRRWPARCIGRSSRRGLRAALVVVLVAVAAAAVWPRYPVRSVAEDENEAARIGRPLRAEMARAFSSGAVGHTVEVDLSRAFFGNNYPFVMLAELQSAGVEFRFAAGSGNLDRFGASRCVDPGLLPRLFLIAGKDPPLEPGSVVLAGVVGIGDSELDEYADLQAAFGDHLRAGEVTVDADAVRGTFGPATSQLDDVAGVLATPGRPAAGLARSLEAWQRWGDAHIPAALDASFQRWFDLERRSSSDYQTVVLAPPGIDPTHQDPAARC